MSGADVSALVWGAEAIIALCFSIYQIWLGLKQHRRAENPVEKVWARGPFLSGILGFMGFAFFLSAALTAMALPMPPPPGSAEGYAEQRSFLVRSELIMGFFFIVLLVGVPAYTERAVKRAIGREAKNSDGKAKRRVR